MKKEQEIIQSLHPLERKILPYLNIYSDLDSLLEITKLKEVETMRALHWLGNKKIISLKIQTKIFVSLDKNGLIYKEKGLPEKRFLQSILDKPLTLKEIREKANINEDELTVSIGILKNKLLINIKKEISLAEQGKNYLKKESLEEIFLKSLPKSVSNLTDEERYAYQELSKRKDIIKTEIKKIRTFELTDLGRNLIKIPLSEKYIEALTPEIIKSDLWKKNKFRHYNINTIVHKIHYGKKHPVTQAIEYIRRIWLDMGFQEMQGDIIQSSFWNLDALFVPQDHPARELQDTLFLENIKLELPGDLVNKVKATHENGWITGSKGWQQPWSKEIAKKPLLRTHTTVLSAQTLAKLKHLPGKFFSIGKVFRNETLDWSHLFEFHQTEGIVVDENMNFKHLLGYLKEFFQRMGFSKIKFIPSYYPYTEMSTDIIVYHQEKKKWIELGGSGIFRPEVVKPLLGKDIPVLAWGLGIERILMDYYNLQDIRDLYKNDIKQLRRFKLFIK